jgi:hypothetical protein
VSQPLLPTTIKNQTEKSHQEGPPPGPVFEPGPGWGFYVKRWFKKYFFKIILPALVIIALMGIFTAHRGTENKEAITNKQAIASQKIALTIIKGDSRALLARKALTEYLRKNPEELTKGQKLFIEETLRRKLNQPKLIVGEVIEFTADDIKNSIAQAKQLTQFQLQKWEELAEKAGF